MRILALLLLSSILLFSRLGHLALIDPDEPRYAESAREMMISGDYAVPHLNFTPRVNKPILFYWLILASYKIFGVNEFAARFPSAVFGLILILGLYFWVRKELSGKEAFLSSLILLSTPIFFVVSRLAIIDTVFTTLILFSLFALWSSLRNRKFLVLFSLFLGLSLAAKGPVGVIIIFLAALVFSLIQRDSTVMKRFFHPLGILTILIIGGSWYFLLIDKIGWVQFKSLVLQETLGRFQEGFVHKEPYYYYLPVLLGGFLPWSLFLFSFKKIDFKNEFIKFLIIFVLVTFSFFTFCKTKLPTYILSIFPAMAVISSGIIARIWNQKRKEPIALFFIFLFCALFMLFLPLKLMEPLTLSAVRKISLALVLISAAFLFLSKFKMKTQFFCFLLLPALIYFFLLSNFGDEFSRYRSCRELFKSQDIAQDEIYTWNIFSPSMVFYSRKKVKELSNLKDFKGKYLIIKKEDWRLFAGYKLSSKAVSETYKYYLLKVFAE